MMYSTFYELKPEEIHRAFQGIFGNAFVYSVIDFSNTPWMDNLDDTSKKVVEDTLVEVVRKINGDPGINGSPRLRFSKYIDPYNFELVSDYQVVGPFKEYNLTSPNILNGLVLNSDTLSYKIGSFLSCLVSTKELV